MNYEVEIYWHGNLNLSRGKRHKREIGKNVLSKRRILKTYLNLKTDSLN